ncbi:MAG: AmmeMemoRadiSam system protein B [Desulfobulbaceae bacterium]|nr:AmmeMemoRadiSam system protein B [Desulfobulbaceae bacterium]
MLRKPAVAYQFYPGESQELHDTISDFLPSIPKNKREALAVIMPHAGYFYSGAVAAETIAGVPIPPTVIVLGPNHHGQGKSLALGKNSWAMPFGEATIDKELAEKILQNSSIIVHDESAHQAEHSLEVQIPFLQYFKKDVKIVPIVVSHLPYSQCLQAARDLATAILEYKKPVLLVASSDMSHYESRESASRKDHMALQHIEELDPKGLYDTVLGNNITMCGIMPVTISLLTVLALGASRAELIKYTDSGEASGDTRQVVGYAGVVIR